VVACADGERDRTARGAPLDLEGSELADRFVADPRDVVKVGDRVRVRVLSVDLGRRRISLSRKD